VTRGSLLEEMELSPRTRKLYDGHLRRFYAFLAGREVSEESILAYLDKLDKKGLSRNYIKTCFKVLKANLPVWPISRERTKKIKFGVDPSTIHQPVLRADAQAKMLAWARSVGDVEGEAFLAVSSIYGARSIEIASLTEEDILEGGAKLRIKTRKHGETRIHLVPKEIQPVLLRHKFRPVSDRRSSTIFRRMYLNSVENHVKRTGWHSIRRSLVTELIRAKLDFNVIGSFLRWKMSADVFEIPRMIAVYDQRPFEEVDRMVFKVHPFIGMWR
jgi:integrase